MNKALKVELSTKEEGVNSKKELYSTVQMVKR